MSKHTPGPWEVYDQAEDEGSDPNEYGCTISSTTDKDADWIAGDIYVRADARLIAAAPELLEALTMLVNHPGPCSKSHKGCARGRAAIAKAEGR